MNRIIMYPMSIICAVFLNAQTTTVSFDLNKVNGGEIEVTVVPPDSNAEWEYIIPTIIPGTYMKINYERFYKKMIAIDQLGEKMKIKRKDNVFQIKGNHPLKELKYTVRQSMGDGKIWDNILSCAGTVLNDRSALLNFQLINGYFEGYRNYPFHIEVMKPESFYASSSIEKEVVSPQEDILKAPSYDELIDQPVLYNKPDTTSFTIGENKFKIAVHSEKGLTTSKRLLPKLKSVMHAIDTFSGFTSKEDYYLLFYFADFENMRGLFKRFGNGSALEHKHSSVYYRDDYGTDWSFNYYEWIVPHEYFHTITPLSLHSDKIHTFNFRNTDMSRHIWMYEGVTDYFAALLNAQSNELNQSFTYSLSWAIHSTEKHAGKSLTESSQNIIRKKNIISFINKISQLGNFYEQGKLLALAIDIELLQRSNGKRRSIDLLLELEEEYKGTYFVDKELKSILVQHSYPKMAEFYDQFISGKEIPPYDKYLNLLGYTYHPEGTKVPSYGIFNFDVDSTETYFVNYAKKNVLGFEKNDIVITINDQPVSEFMNDESNLFYHKIIYPAASDVLTVDVLRKGQKIILSSSPKMKKLKYPRIKVSEKFTPDQEHFRKLFFKEGD